MTHADPLEPALAAALVTVRRGATFLEGGLALPGAGVVADRYRARLAGNGLREIDGFLNLLLDAASDVAGRPTSPDQTNTAAKYRSIAPLAVADHRRLLALGRSRACLFYCEGVVRRPDRRGGSIMTLGWRDKLGGLGKAQLGDELKPGLSELGDIARFYRVLADRVIAAI